MKTKITSSYGPEKVSPKFSKSAPKKGMGAKKITSSASGNKALCSK